MSKDCEWLSEPGNCKVGVKERHRNKGTEWRIKAARDLGPWNWIETEK